jgi:hypothetical protein
MMQCCQPCLEAYFPRVHLSNTQTLNNTKMRHIGAWVHGSWGTHDQRDSWFTKNIIHIIIINDEMDSHYHETRTIALVMRILKDRYFQNQVNRSHGHKKGRGETPIIHSLKRMCIVGGFVHNAISIMSLHFEWEYFVHMLYTNVPTSI